MQRLVCLGVYVLCLVAFNAHAEEPTIPVGEKMVARAQFTSAIVNREPVDQLVIVSPPQNSVYFFTDLRFMEGHTIMHRWEYQGQVMSQMTFQVKGPRWRVNSKVVLEPGAYGDWTVTVLDETGWPWYVELFRYAPLDHDLPQSAGRLHTSD